MKTIEHPRPNGDAPHIEGFHVGSRMRLAWQAMWDAMTREQYQDGYELSACAEQASGVKAVSARSLLHRLAADGVLETTKRNVPTEVTRPRSKGSAEMVTYPMLRKRTFYRIASRP
jgi:hypothetical protein